MCEHVQKSYWGQKYKHKCTHTHSWVLGIEYVYVCVKGIWSMVNMSPCNLLNSSLCLLLMSLLLRVSSHTHTHTLLSPSSSQLRNIVTHIHRLFFINILSGHHAAVRYCSNWFPHQFKNTGFKNQYHFPHCKREQRQQYDTCCKVTLHHTTEDHNRTFAPIMNYDLYGWLTMV